MKARQLLHRPGWNFPVFPSETPKGSAECDRKIPCDVSLWGVHLLIYAFGEKKIRYDARWEPTQLLLNTELNEIVDLVTLGGLHPLGLYRPTRLHLIKKKKSMSVALTNFDGAIPKR